MYLLFDAQLLLLDSLSANVNIPSSRDRPLMGVTWS